MRVRLEENTQRNLDHLQIFNRVQRVALGKNSYGTKLCILLSCTFTTTLSVDQLRTRTNVIDDSSLKPRQYEIHSFGTCFLFADSTKPIVDNAYMPRSH